MRKQIKKFTTDPHLIKQTLSNYSNTFVALKELIVNSMQAFAKTIKISFEGDSPDIVGHAITAITIWDDGHGLPYSKFDQSFMNIGTHNKKDGHGVGRFAAFQLGQVMEIESAAFDPQINKYTKIHVRLDVRQLTQSLEHTDVEVNVEESDAQMEQYYQVRITDLYNNEQSCARKNRLGKYFEESEFRRLIFEEYAFSIFEDKVKFYINDDQIEKQEYIEEPPHTRDTPYIDVKGGTHTITYHFYRLKLVKKDISVLVQSKFENAYLTARRYGYACKWHTPDLGAWFIYVNSDMLNNETIPDLDFDELGNRETTSILANIRQTIDEFFRERNKEYDAFVTKLMEDEHYPYELSSDEIGLSESMFRKTVYLVENQEKLLEKNETVRQIVYPMVKKLLEEGDARFIVDKVLSLPEEKKQQLHALLQTADFEEIIRFSSQVARKQQFIKFLEELTYGKLSKSIKERSQLHKIVQNELWIFNEAYNGTPQLWSDKSLANNLDELHRKYFEYEPTEIDENLIEDYKDTVRDITDLFFYNEKRLVNGRREVMIVELKSPSCAISNHEMNQAKRYAFDIHKYPKFDKSQVCYKIILISSHLTERAKSEINNFPNLGEIGLFDRKIENGEDIRVYAMTWSELIERNKRALSYLSESLTLKEKEATEIFRENYPELLVEKAQARLMPR